MHEIHSDRMVMNLTHVAPSLSKQGIWGPVTATLDWCEINHQFSPYIAEMANTLSNLFTIGLSLVGFFDTVREGLPRRYPVGYLGVALIGVGSFIFHATLKFGAQLADELPMIYVGSLTLWLLLDDTPGFSLHRTHTKLLVAGIVAFDLIFTWSYIVYRNPIYHQVIFASIIVLTAVGTTYILQCTSGGMAIPPKTKSSILNFFNTGLGLFAFGFFVWNMDNIFCHRLTGWKVTVGWPIAFFLEGHSWWHILTGLGTYYMFIGIQYATLCVKDRPEGYTVKRVHGVPFVRRIRIKNQ